MKVFFSVLLSVSSFVSQVSFAQTNDTLKLSCLAEKGASLVVVHSYSANESERFKGFSASAIFLNEKGTLQSSTGLGAEKGSLFNSKFTYSHSESTEIDFLNNFSVSSFNPGCGRSPDCNPAQSISYSATLAAFNNSTEIAFNCTVIK